MRQWNLSYTCLTGFEARDKLRNIRTTDPDFWNELTQHSSDTTLADLPASGNEQLPEDMETEFDKADTTLEDEDADDSDLPISTLINTLITTDGNLPLKVGARRNGTLTSIAESENFDLVIEPTSAELPVAEGSGGRGKRVRRPNQLYSEFWRHDDEDSDNEEDE